MIRYYHFAQRSKQWYVMRLGRWTGSTAIDLLKGKKTPAENDGDYDNKYMQRGRILEPLAIEAYEKSLGRLGSVKHYGFITNSKYKHAGYSPDGILGNTLLEVKCLNEKGHQGLADGKIPVAYQAQIQFGLLISELPFAELISYNPDADRPLIMLAVFPDPDTQANLKAKLKETEPKRKPSQLRADRAYVKNNPDKIRESGHRRYLKSKGVIIDSMNKETQA